MSDVPEDLLPEILKRLPAESLIYLRSVCKTWCQLIDDPVFAKMQLRHQEDGGDRLIICRPTNFSGNLYSLPLSSINYSGESTKSVEAISVKNLSRRGVSPIRSMPVPSCHGLILICHCDCDVKYTWTVWNPLTRTFIELPSYNHSTRGVSPSFRGLRYDVNSNGHEVARSSFSAGIGYDLKTDDYKVVRVKQLHNHHLDTLVYSLKSKAWRRIEDYPPYVYPICSEYGVFFNGALYWFAKREEEGLVLAFDLDTERYRQIPMPQPTFALKCQDETRVESVSGCLFVTYFYCRWSSMFDIWMLNDDHGENIWDVLVSLKLPSILGNRLKYPRLMSYSKTKQQVVIQNLREFLLFDVEKKCGTQVSVLELDGSFSCQAFPLSLIQLNGSSSQTYETTALKGSLKRKRMTPSKSLPLKLKFSDFLNSFDGKDDSTSSVEILGSYDYSGSDSFDANDDSYSSGVMLGSYADGGSDSSDASDDSDSSVMILGSYADDGSDSSDAKDGSDSSDAKDGSDSSDAKDGSHWPIIITIPSDTEDSSI